MLVSVLLFIVGLVLLIFGGDWFVDGAVGIAKKFHLPELLIGATVVSIGTTLPEVMVSASAAIGGMGDTSYGNAIGSIICNTSLIAAISMTFAPGGKVNKKTFRAPIIFLFASMAFFCLISYTSGYFSRVHGIILLAAFVVYMFVTVRQALKNRTNSEIAEITSVESIEPSENDGSKADNEEHNDESDKLLFGKIKINPTIKMILLLVLGAVAIALGANLLVDNGIIIAQELGVPQTVIALTFIALGTSLPELVTAITSLIKGHGSLSFGNIIGANLFNIVLVMAASIVINPFEMPKSQLFGMTSSLILDIPVMLAVTLIMAVPSLIKGKTYRWQGIALLCIYAAFCASQFFIS